MNKKIFLLAFGVFFVLASLALIDAALCRGFDGYYHDCGYSYGHNSYRYRYGDYYDRDHRVIYLNSNYKQYNPINDYYIIRGPGYERPRYDLDIRYRDDRDGRYRRSRNVRFISDERDFEYRINYYDPDARLLRIYIDESNRSCPSGFVCI